MTNNEMMKKLPVPFPRCYWVVPGKFLAGFYPGSQKSTIVLKQLRSLLEHGIRRILSLMEEQERNYRGELFVPYENELFHLAAEMGLEVELDRMPIPDTDIPTVKGMIAILDRIDQSIEQGRTLYLHCWGGRGRTGTVVGCFLARHGLAVGEAALGLLQELRQNDPISHMPSPETKIQADFIRSWPKGK
jgi:protein-tyrosine phosphatase